MSEQKPFRCSFCGTEVPERKETIFGSLKRYLCDSCHELLRAEIRHEIGEAAKKFRLLEGGRYEPLIKQRDAEVIGGCKMLNWLSFEFQKGMTVKDIVETVEYAEAIFREELWDIFNREHGVFTHLSHRIEERKKQQATTAAIPEIKEDP